MLATKGTGQFAAKKRSQYETKMRLPAALRERMDSPKHSGGASSLALYGKRAYYQRLDPCDDNSISSTGSTTGSKGLGSESIKSESESSSQRGLLAIQSRSDVTDETRDDCHTSSRAIIHSKSDPSLPSAGQLTHHEKTPHVFRAVRSLIPAPFRTVAVAAEAPLQSDDFDTTETYPATHASTLVDTQKHDLIPASTAVAVAQSIFTDVSDGCSNDNQQSAASDEQTLLEWKRLLGVKVTVVSKELKVFVVTLLPPEACDEIRRLTKKHVEHETSIGRGDMTFRALYTYSKLDIPCCEIAGLEHSMDQISSYIKEIMALILVEPEAAAKLEPRSWKEPHMLLYDCEMQHTGIPMHHDGSDWTWNLMLSHESEYAGGGTYIRALGKTIMLRQGQVLIHPGNLYHKGVDITSGTRQLVVCFLDGHPSNVDDTPSNDEDDEPREHCILRI